MRVMAATLRLYPFGEITRLEAPKKQARAKTTGDKRKNKARWHEWAATLTGWQCGLCKELRPHSASHLLDLLGCPGANKAVRMVGSANGKTSHGLNRVVFSNGHDVVYCRRCGIWGTKRTLAFSRVCAARPLDSGKQVLSRINKGMHPKRTADCKSATMLDRPVACTAKSVFPAPTSRDL